MYRQPQHAFVATLLWNEYKYASMRDMPRNTIIHTMRTPVNTLLERELHLVQREHHIIERELALLEHQRQLEEYEQTLASREHAICHYDAPPPTPNHQTSASGGSTPSILGSLNGAEVKADKCECGEETCRQLAQARRELIRAADTDDTDTFMAKFWALYQRESQRKCHRSVDEGAGAIRREE